MKEFNEDTAATFLVDAQKGFTPICPNELPVPDGDNIVGECLKTFKKTRYKIASKDVHAANADWITNTLSAIATPIDISKTFRPQVDLYWPRHCEAGTAGVELIPGLPPIEEFDFVVYKGIEKNIHVYSAIYHLLNPNKSGNRISTGVVEFLKYNDIYTVIIVGLATNYCCMATAMDLAEAGFRVIMNLGGCRGIGDINSAVEKMKAVGIEFVNSSEELGNYGVFDYEG